MRGNWSQLYTSNAVFCITRSDLNLRPFAHRATTWLSLLPFIKLCWNRQTWLTWTQTHLRTHIYITVMSVLSRLHLFACIFDGGWQVSLRNKHLQGFNIMMWIKNLSLLNPLLQQQLTQYESLDSKDRAIMLLTEKYLM